MHEGIKLFNKRRKNTSTRQSIEIEEMLGSTDYYSLKKKERTIKKN